MSAKKIKIYDTTLRDGEQTPGVNLNFREKLEIAKQLAALGVDVIEPGFPNASQGDFNSVAQIAKEVRACQISGFARALPADIQRAWEAVRFAEAPRLHIFIATSEVHMQHKLKMSEDEVLDRAFESVRLAKTFCADVEFSAEDASRSNPQFLYKVLTKVIGAGATVVNIPDTVGYTMPHEFASLIRGIQENVCNIDKAVISVHCHNDLGMAVANSLAAIEIGAEQVECTLNGMGERAGNAALEEIIMALNTRHDYYQAEHNIKTNQLFRTSRLVSNYSGFDVAPNKPIVGDNAFRHESGIHQHGVLCNRSTYEIMTPESIGLYQFDGIVLGKLSGRHAFEEKIRSMGYQLDNEAVKDCFAKFKALCDRKKDITYRDIEAIVEGSLTDIPAVIELENYQIISSNSTNSTATVSLNKDYLHKQDAAIGSGPVDAAFKAIDKIINIPLTLESYSIKAVTEGKDAIGEATVKVKYQDNLYLGRGISTDIIEASLLSYINAVNRIIANM